MKVIQSVNIFVHLILLTLLISSIVHAQEKSKVNSKKLVLRVSDAIFLALRENRSIKSAYLNRVAQKYSLAVAEDQFNPDLFITPTLKQDSSKSTVDRSTTNGAGVSVNIPLPLKSGGKFNFIWDNQFTSPESGDNSYKSSWRLNFTQPLLRGFGIDVTTSNLVSARIANDNQILDLQSTIMQTITSVIQAHRSYQQAVRQKGIAETALKRNIKLLEVNKELIKAGRLAKSQIIQAEADIAVKKLAVLTAENNLVGSRLSLIQTIDIDQTIMIDPREKRTVKPLTTSLAELQKIAFNNRPDYLKALNGMNLSKIRLGVAKNRRLWELNFESGIGESNQDKNFGEASKGLADLGESEWNAGLKLTIPFGDWFRHEPYVGALIDLKNQRISLKEVKQNIEIDIQNQLRNAKIRYQQVLIARQSKVLAKKKLTIENERLRSGRSTNFQIVTFQNDLLNAEISELDAGIAYKNSLVNLDLALGTTLKTWKIEMEEKPESGSEILLKLDK